MGNVKLHGNQQDNHESKDKPSNAQKGKSRPETAGIVPGSSFSFLDFIKRHAIAIGIVGVSLFFLTLSIAYIYLLKISKSSYLIQTPDYSKTESLNGNAPRNADKQSVTERVNLDDSLDELIEEPQKNVEEPQKNIEEQEGVVDGWINAVETKPTIPDIVRPNEDEIIPIDKSVLHEKAKEYNGKWVKIAGKITYINDFEENDIIHMDGRSDLRTIYCYLAPDQDISTVEVDDYITIVGKVDGKVLGQLILNDSYIDGYGKESKDLELALQEKADQDDKATAIQLTAKQAYQEYTDNQVACKNKYDGKYIAITGTIDDIGTNIFGQEYVTFDVGDEWAIESVQCFFKNEMMDYVSTLKKGQKITIYGIADVGSFDFKIGDCHP